VCITGTRPKCKSTAKNLDNSDLLKTEIAYDTPIFTAVTRNHGNGKKSR